MASATSVAIVERAGVRRDQAAGAAHMRREDETIRRAQAGDREAYGELVRAHQELAFRVAFLVTSSGADAEEAVQEAFIKAHRALRRFRAGQPFRPWILRIVTNEAYTVVRSRSRHRVLAELQPSPWPAPGQVPVGRDEQTKGGLCVPVRGTDAMSSRHRPAIGGMSPRSPD